MALVQYLYAMAHYFTISLLQAIIYNFRAQLQGTRSYSEFSYKES